MYKKMLSNDNSDSKPKLNYEEQAKKELRQGTKCMRKRLKKKYFRYI